MCQTVSIRVGHNSTVPAAIKDQLTPDKWTEESLINMNITKCKYCSLHNTGLENSIQENWNVPI